MFKKIILLLAITFSSCLIASADVKKVAVVDVQKIVANSSQVKALTKEQDAKKQELARFIKTASENIRKQTDEAKKKELAKKYDKEFKAKKDANEKAYVAKLSAIDKSIDSAIIQQAKAMGYDLVLVKGVVLYGGDDITEAISKVVK